MSKAIAIVFVCGITSAAASVACADILSYSAVLDGPSESPVNASPGTGTALVDVDTVANTMRVRVTFTGLTGNVTASHIHSATAVPFTGTTGVATTTPTFTSFPSGVTSGTYDHLFDMTLASSFNASFITGHGGTTTSAAAFLFASFDTGQAYLNIHTSTFGGGEIRGFLRPVPAPGAAAMLMGVSGLAAFRRRRA